MTIEELRRIHNGRYVLLIGIDVGVHTGVSTYNPATKNLKKFNH